MVVSGCAIFHSRTVSPFMYTDGGILLRRTFLGVALGPLILKEGIVKVVDYLNIIAVQLHPSRNGLPSRMESSEPLLLYAGVIICNKCLYSYICIVFFCSSPRSSYVSQDKNTRRQQQKLLLYIASVFATENRIFQQDSVSHVKKIELC
ncbi:hypothetical protein TNCV_4543711 [Trichonephila clavipes]|nr:hypothetical protein TNCV_4543711 [Trichonephila clavipes]